MSARLLTRKLPYQPPTLDTPGKNSKNVRSFLVFSTHSSRVDVRSLSDLFRPVTSSTYYYDASEAAAAAVTVGRC